MKCHVANSDMLCKYHLSDITTPDFLAWLFFFLNGYIADVSAYAERPQKGSVRS